MFSQCSVTVTVTMFIIDNGSIIVYNSLIIQFYENNIVPSKEVTCYPNNKPWLTKELKQNELIAKRQYINIIKIVYN